MSNTELTPEQAKQQATLERIARHNGTSVEQVLAQSNAAKGTERTPGQVAALAALVYNLGSFEERAL